MKQKSNKGLPIFLYLTLALLAVIIFFIGINYANKSYKSVYKAPKVERTIVQDEYNVETPTSADPATQIVDATETTLEPIQNFETNKEMKLFYVVPLENGLFSLKSITTTVGYNGKQALTATINALIDNKNLDNKNYYMIPEGSKLLSANVVDGIAYLNFNDNFRFNTFGIDGSKAQLNQVVYTATEFSTVKKVKILINGQDVDFLQEGIDISKPLQR